nr:uncharacterized protein LOC119713085 [Anas platyrhynchos]
MQTAESIIRDCLGKSESFSAPFLSSPIIEIFLFTKVDLIRSISSVDLRYLHVSPCFPWLINHSLCLSNWSSACCAPATCSGGPRLFLALLCSSVALQKAATRRVPPRSHPESPAAGGSGAPGGCLAGREAQGCLFAAEQNPVPKSQIKQPSSSLGAAWCLSCSGTQTCAWPLLCPARSEPRALLPAPSPRGAEQCCPQLPAVVHGPRPQPSPSSLTSSLLGLFSSCSKTRRKKGKKKGILVCGIMFAVFRGHQDRAGAKLCLPGFLPRQLTRRAALAPGFSCPGSKGFTAQSLVLIQGESTR